MNGFGDFTTIAAALTASSSGQTIFIRPGTYSENLTLKAGVNLTAFGCDDSLNGTGNVIISGNATLSGAGTVTISGIQLQTNSAALLTVSGSAASIVNLNNCYLNMTNSTGISFSSSSGSSVINLYYCIGDLGTTGIAIYTSTAAGSMNFNYCTFTNSGLSTTASSNSAVTFTFAYSQFASAFSTSSTGGVNFDNSIVNCGAINTAAITTAGTASQTQRSSIFRGGSASSISIGTGTTCNVYNCFLQSTNTNNITGAGTLNYQALTFSGSAQTTINTTTQTVAGTLYGGINQAPVAGMLGQQLTTSASAVATTSTSDTTIASVTLTAGIWDVSAICSAVPTAGTALMSIMKAGIGTTTNSLTGTLGQDFGQISVAAGTLTIVVPVIRATLTASTTYYLVANNTYSSTTCPTNGRITATRVG